MRFVSKAVLLLDEFETFSDESVMIIVGEHFVEQLEARQLLLLFLECGNAFLNVIVRVTALFLKPVSQDICVRWANVNTQDVHAQG